MTLILSVGAGHKVIQVSDRRMSFGGERYDDTTNKAVMVECLDGTCVLAYTGLGIVGARKQKTDRWVVDNLREAPTLTMRDVAAELGSRAASVIHQSEGAPSDKALTFVGAGFLKDGRSVVFRVSNLLDDDGHTLSSVSPTFSYDYHDNETRFVSIEGKEDAATEVKGRLHAQTAGGVFTRLPGTAVRDELVRAMRKAAARPLAESSIGADCISIVLERDRPLTAEVRFHPRDESQPIEYGCSLIAGNMQLANIQSRECIASPPSAIPFDEWPILSLSVSVTNGGEVIRISNIGESLDDVVVAITEDRVDLGHLAGARLYSPGFSRRFNHLETGAVLQQHLTAFETLADGQVLAPSEAATGYVTVIGRFSNGLFGGFVARVQELSI